MEWKAPVITELYPDKNDKKDVLAHTYQDVEPILEDNRHLRSMPQKSDWGRHVASVPNNIIYQWLVEEWTRGNHGLRLHSDEWKRLVKRKLQDPEWAYLRTDK